MELKNYCVKRKNKINRNIKKKIEYISREKKIEILLWNHASNNNTRLNRNCENDIKINFDLIIKIK